jgi:hypothetical protein
MVLEDLIIKEIVLAEIAPRMRQDLSLSIITDISIFNMILDSLDIVKFLFTDKNQSSLKTNFTESLLMLVFHVLLKLL